MQGKDEGKLGMCTVTDKANRLLSHALYDNK